MTRKDYIKLAQAVKENTNGDGRTIYLEPFLTDLCSILKADNSHFDKATFRFACTPDKP